MKEWKDSFNSFNCELKGALYSEWYNSILKWKETSNPSDLKVPIEASIDTSPNGACSVNCRHCNAHKYLGKTVAVGDKEVLDLHKFLIDWGVKAFCFTGDTKVKLVNGEHKTFKELSEKWNLDHKSFEVYSRDDNGNIVPGVASNPRKIKEVTELIELELDNKKHIKCTADHLFMVKTSNLNDCRLHFINGLPYIKACDLTEKDSLMPLYTSIKDGYEYIKDTTYRGYTHLLFSKFHYNKKISLLDNVQTHHCNLNKLDNTKQNLNPITNEEHSSIHGKIKCDLPRYRKIFDKARDNWNDSEKGKEHIQNLGKLEGRMNLINYNKSQKGRKKSGEIFTKYNKENLEICINRITNYNKSEAGRKNSLLQLEKINNNEIIREKLKNILNTPEVKEKTKLSSSMFVFDKLRKLNLDITEENYNKHRPNGYIGWTKAKKYLTYNHKIISKKLVYLDKPISVYCLTVEKYNNFALSAGVFVKNCEGGGGEPTMRKNLSEIFWLTKKHDRQSSIATNGVLFTDELIDAMANCCRWVAISPDSATKETYLSLKRRDYFDRVIENISKLVKKVWLCNSNCDVSYKFLVSPWNYKEIFEACKLAKSLGVKDFHCRIGDMSHQGMGDIKLKDFQYDKDYIIEQFEKCHYIENENFRVMTPVHKFDSDFKPLKRFSQCYAMPLLIQCCPDGNVYSCVDQRLQDSFKLGSYIPDPKNILNFWGSKKHYNLTFKTGFKQCDSRCTFTKYNEICERVFVNDDDILCKWFT